ncbi:hypothetical protein F4820DRAFT_210159 [Hypoxylon rubiginosum]|uniref:Uncharacterized protein n=1 Tax=Hypoxylon rubiginosum TaxID=110542 RepID=A0ACB9Z871_9PEZI|nr:hypothetical protein F4820DRAFT_210159 [Hypoxylon rubiginosum]
MSSSDSETSSNADAARIDFLEKSDYRSMNLAALGINYRARDKSSTPAWVADLIAKMQKACLDEEARLKKPRPINSQSQLSKEILLEPKEPPIGMSSGLLFKQHIIPRNPARYWIEIADPKPDMVLGYEASISAFSRLATSERLWRQKDLLYVNSDCLMFPYLIWNEVPWDCTRRAIINKCLGESAACIHVNERVFKEDNVVFSIVPGDRNILLNVMWKEDDEYLSTTFETLNLCNLDEYTKYGRILLNIHDWAKGERLAAITKGLDAWKG